MNPSLIKSTCQQLLRIHIFRVSWADNNTAKMSNRVILLLSTTTVTTFLVLLTIEPCQTIIPIETSYQLEKIGYGRPRTRSNGGRGVRHYHHVTHRDGRGYSRKRHYHHRRKHYCRTKKIIERVHYPVIKKVPIYKQIAIPLRVPIKVPLKVNVHINTKRRKKKNYLDEWYKLQAFGMNLHQDFSELWQQPPPINFASNEQEEFEYLPNKVEIQHQEEPQDDQPTEHDDNFNEAQPSPSDVDEMNNQIENSAPPSNSDYDYDRQEMAVDNDNQQQAPAALPATVGKLYRDLSTKYQSQPNQPQVPDEDENAEPIEAFEKDIDLTNADKTKGEGNDQNDIEDELPLK